MSRYSRAKEGGWHYPIAPSVPIDNGVRSSWSHDRPEVQNLFWPGMGVRKPAQAVWEEERGCQCGAGMPCECQGDLDGVDESLVLDISCPQAETLAPRQLLLTFLSGRP